MTDTTSSPRPSHGHGGHEPSGAIAEVLDLDAELLSEHTAAIVAWLPITTEPRHIIDLGCGTGAGTFALLEQFPDARITAVDSSPDHLQRLQDKAREAGLGEHITTVETDLDTDWPSLGTPDLVWASASLHHMRHAEAALRRVRGLLAPGGLLVVIEPDGFPRFLPDEAPENRPGVEKRAHEVGDRRAGEHMPHRGADFAPLLAAAGFTVEADRTVDTTIELARSKAVGRYALIGLRGIRHGVADALPTEDLAALDQLLDVESPHSLLRREDLAMRTRRTVWAARP